jgi:hypothetical protein
MATSQTPNRSRRRPAVGDRAVSGAATPPGTDPTPDNTTEHHPGHRHARGTSLKATPPEPPEPEDVNADKADDSPALTVIMKPQDFRLPDVLRHIEAGRIVVLIPQDDGPD